MMRQKNMSNEARKSTTVILYEYPFNERIRTYLRLEHLLQRLGQLVKRESPVDHHYALATIFEIMDVGARADLKTDVLKDLEKQKQMLSGYRGNPAISESVLDDITAQLEGCFAAVNKLPGKVGQSLTENDWLMSIRSRAGIPGGTCEFDLPAYHAWQHKPAHVRQEDLQQWMAHLLPLGNSIKLLLLLLRGTGQPSKMTVQAGNFQQNLPQNRTFQLLRLQMDAESALIPEISANRLIVTIRMMQQEAQGHLVPYQENAEFQLTLCT